MKMMKTINRNWLISLALIVCYLTMSPVKAQEVNVSADVVSQYVWRGLECGSGVAWNVVVHRCSLHSAWVSRTSVSRHGVV